METPTTETPEQETPNYSLLAKEMFPNQFHGEVKEPEKKEESVEVETTEEAEAAEEVEAEEVEAQPAETEIEEETEEEVIQSFDDLVETQEWDKEWTDNLTVNVKVDGAEQSVKLSDLRDNYQIKQAAEKRLEEAKQAKEAAKTEAASVVEEAQKQLIVTAKLVEKAEKSLGQEVSSADMEKLREQDPAEWAAKNQEFKEREQNLATLKQEALDEFQKVVSQNHEKQQQALLATVQAEAEKLITAIPEWKDEEKATAQKAEVGKYLSSIGFSDQEINNAYDHRMIVLARKAMMFDQGQKNLEPARKKLKKVVKAIPPGKTKTQPQINQERTQAAKERLRKTGKLDDAAALLGLR